MRIESMSAGGVAMTMASFKEPIAPLWSTWDLPEGPCLSTAKAFFNLMQRIRRFEEKAAQVYTLGKIGGFCHLCIGQEAISAALAFACQPVDTCVTAYRAHGHALAKGLSEFQVLAELMGKAQGCSQGKGGSMHMFSKEAGFYGGHGIVGAQIPIGVGLALAHKYTQDGGVCLTFLGDGASNQGQFFEAMNMASLWNLPVIFIIENNGYAMGTSVERACAGGPLWQRALPFGIQGGLISGHDSLALYRVLKAMMHHVRLHSRPLILEVDTYRFKGHSMSDPAKYRTREELDHARKVRDPISHIRNYLREKDVPETELCSMEEAVDAHIQAIFDEVEALPAPSQDLLFRDILTPCMP